MQVVLNLFPPKAFQPLTGYFFFKYLFSLFNPFGQTDHSTVTLVPNRPHGPRDRRTVPVVPYAG